MNDKYITADPALQTPIKKSEPSDPPDHSYLVMLLDYSSKCYYHAANTAQSERDEKKEIYFRGKYDAMVEALKHVLELK